MSNNKKMGSHFILGITGTTLLEKEALFLKENDVFGVILFAHNYESVEQITKVIHDLKQVKKNRPLMICVDQEGGRVVRFRKGFTVLPPMLEIGTKKSVQDCFNLHLTMGKELFDVGIDLDFSPVCDIFSNLENKVIGDRSFGHNAKDILPYIEAAILAFKKAHILTCAKHFPGHGDTLLDSHDHLPHVHYSLGELENREFIPFKKAIEVGVDYLMMAHLLCPAIDEKLPCSLSPNAYKMCRQFGFQGPFITDDMEMGAITQLWGEVHAAELALAAGADYLIYRHFETGKRIIDALA